MDCRRCGSAQPDNARYCNQCGAPLAAVASEAGRASDPQPSGQLAGPSTAPLEAPPPGRRRRILAAVAAAVVVLAALAVTGWREHWPAALFGRASSQAPADATRAVANLVSRSPATVRDSLAAVYSAQVNSGVLAPAGTRIRVQPGTWQQHSTDASLRALVTVPGRAPVTEVVYLVREEGRWRVLFTDAP
jgi:hypothetical protein